MRRITWEVVDGKARYNGRGLAEWVSVAVADLVAAADPLRIVLFGSVARGDDGPDSDLDLLVVLPTLDQAQRHLLMANLHSAVSAPVPLDILVTDPQEIELRKDVIGSFPTGPRERVRWCMSGPLEPGDEAFRWLGQATEDLDTARHIQGNPELPARMPCFSRISLRRSHSRLCSSGPARPADATPLSAGGDKRLGGAHVLGGGRCVLQDESRHQRQAHARSAGATQDMTPSVDAIATVANTVSWKAEVSS
ncbi:MAG: nucleotidyltransferase domain-containing protein [Egibacteraceae bacterium]